jgi:ribosome-interacting GTPase 1
MPRKDDRSTHETTRAIARKRREKAKIRREIREATSAWQVAKHGLTYATDGEGRVAAIGPKLRAKTALLNGRIATINDEIRALRAGTKERADAYRAARERARAARKGDRGLARFVDEPA